MITFPSSPSTGQLFVADNAVTYIWTGSAWSSALAITRGVAEYTLDALYPSSTYNSATDLDLDGGTITTPP